MGSAIAPITLFACHENRNRRLKPDFAPPVPYFALHAPVGRVPPPTQLHRRLVNISFHSASVHLPRETTIDSCIIVSRHTTSQDTR